MKKILLSIATVIPVAFNCYSQTQVKAWYANGQVFVVWRISLPLEETYTIYASPTPFTSTTNAALLGRPFALEYLGAGLKDNLSDTTATYQIPDGQGGTYQLGLAEGLFVFTPHQSGSLYFAVTKWGSSSVTAGQNITDNAVSFTYDPVGDPVQCHLQRTFPSPFTSGYICFAYCLWADGRQNQWDGRPDFPIMANAAKNGMPGLFLVSAPTDLNTATAFPLSVWLHGGTGNARQSLAGSRKEININPIQGILVAQDDKMYGYRGTTPSNPDQPTWHFGWGKNYNPFGPNAVLESDTIVNYTQVRYLWIDKWIAENFNVDTNRINIHGHSMGSAGTLGIAKSFPEHYASGTIFNTGCAGPEEDATTNYISGTRADNLPTNLKNRLGQSVRFLDLWDLHTNCSPQRDLPFIKIWHGKSDDNGTMHWGPVVVENFAICDSIGTGIQTHWSERPHGINLAPSYNDHWIMGIPAAQQTANDNVSFAEARYRSNESFPAFFNHRLDPKNNDPGTGLIGLNNGDGDNWGTWGGYHRWENVVETAQSWEVTAWLEGDAIFPNDNSPEDFLTSDLVIRRQQTFMPAFGQPVSWTVKDVDTGVLLQNGSATVQADDLVVIPQVNVYKETIRKVLISITTGITSINEISSENLSLHIFPNPAEGTVLINEDWHVVNIIDLQGAVVQRMSKTHSGQQTIDVSSLPSGVYCLKVLTKDKMTKIGRLVKL